LTLSAADGNTFAAFYAQPSQPSGVAVLVLPDNRGLRTYYEDLTIQLAEQGHPTLVIDYFGRSDGVNRDRPDDFEILPHLFTLSKEGLAEDITAGANYLRQISETPVVPLGFCFGGRLAFLHSTPENRFAGAVGFYGALDEINGAPGPIQTAGLMSGPILALFGGADEHIPASSVAQFDEALSAAGVDHEIVTFEGAPHSFFDLDFDGAYDEACAEAWGRVLWFLEELSA
jgi:carboxymethylenebutenolidase